MKISWSDRPKSGFLHLNGSTEIHVLIASLKMESIIKMISEVKTLRLVRDLTKVLNVSGSFENKLNEALELIQEALQFAAVGMRIESEGDFPYMHSSGFDEEFLKFENSLSKRDSSGEYLSR